MFAIVFIGLALSLLTLLGIGLIAIADVAFAGPPNLHDKKRWQPPLAQGNDLLHWAAGMANAVATKRLHQPLGKDTASELAREIYEGSSFAIARAPGAVRPLKPRCTSCRHRMIGVTAPEALAIADEIQSSQSKPEVKRIRDLAAANAAAAAGLDLAQYKEAQLVCPLLTCDSTCVVYDARPIRCRGWSPAEGEESSLPNARNRCVAPDPYADAVGRGAEEGLAQALESAGLGGEIYELNSALAAALSNADAPAQWIRGEPVFAGCHVYA
ncbi:MAG: hypothetical protein K8R36_17865 [Planctomycetales bacterium]|nr:hypothetical protein [Planctomycetales bacterium]